MAKKRPTLDAFLNSQNGNAAEDEFPNNMDEINAGSQRETTAKREDNSIKNNFASPNSKPGKQETIRHMLYLPLPVYDQLQELIFEEQRGQTRRRKTHDYLLEAIDLLFEKKGLKPISEITKK